MEAAFSIQRRPTQDQRLSTTEDTEGTEIELERTSAEAAIATVIALKPRQSGMTWDALGYPGRGEEYR
jgi:hypothetical protein